jgi:hypothetical protein
VLATILVLKFFALSRKIIYTDEQGLSKFESGIIEIERPKTKVKKEYANIFGVKSTEPVGETTPIATVQSDLNQLITKDNIIRLQGTFITEENRYAVLTITDRKQKDKAELVKVNLGDKIRNFRVDSILPGAVDLSNEASDAIRLRIFKPI